MKKPVILWSLVIVLIIVGGALASESTDILGDRLCYENGQSAVDRQREPNPANIRIEPDDPDLVLHNIMKKVDAGDPYVPYGQFRVELLVEHVGADSSAGRIDVYVLCGSDSQHVTMAHTFYYGNEFIEAGPFDLGIESKDLTIHGYVDLDPPLVDPTPENNVYEIYNKVPCLTFDTLRYDNGVVTDYVAFEDCQQGAAFLNESAFPLLCGFQLGLTDTGNGGPLYVYVWMDDDGDMIPDEIAYTGHYYFADIPDWPDHALYQGSLCMPMLPNTYYWIMVEQKHYDDLGMLSYVCIDDNYDHPHSQWVYDPASGDWAQGWGCNGDPLIRACTGLSRP